MKLFSLVVLLLATAASGQWIKVTVPTNASFRGLSAVSANVVWASGTGGTVIKTLDGGKTWTVTVVPGAAKLDFRGIHAFDDKTAVIISSGPAEQGQAQIYKTTDGGHSWQQVFEEKRAGIFFDAIAFWDRRHGIVLSDPIDGRFALFHTEDGGETWKQAPSSALPPSLANEGAFAASNSCLTVQGEKHVWFATGGARVARVFRSSDRGETWQLSETPMHPGNASSGIFSLAFSDAKNGVAVGGDYAHPEGSELPNVMSTSDGGQNWRVGAGASPAGVYLSSVVVEGDLIVSGGPGGIWSHSASSSYESSENVNALALGGDVLWAAGPKGTIVKRSRK